MLTDAHGDGGERAEVRKLAERAREGEDDADERRDDGEHDRARRGVRERVQELRADKDVKGCVRGVSIAEWD